MKYADIIVDISVEQLDRIFQYRIPEAFEERVYPGVRVEIPFGKGNRSVTGYCIRMTDKPSCDPEKIKEILSVREKEQSLESHMITLAAWIRETYGCTMTQALHTVLPVQRKTKFREKRIIHLTISREEAAALLEQERKKSHKARARLLEALMQAGSLEYTSALKELKITAGALRPLEQQGILFVENADALPGLSKQEDVSLKIPALNDEQSSAFDEICEEWDTGEGRPVLLHGITGSGKTVIYMHLILRELEAHRQVILLVPEIALTYQNVQRFYECFGRQVAVLHSRLSDGEKAQQFERVRNGEASIMIGPRSALFAPFSRLGLIIMDEEQESSYHSEKTPRYHARETAQQRASLEHARFLMGSATPSTDAYYRCETGQYRKVTLRHRFGPWGLPRVCIADMRKEMAAGNRSILSRQLSRELNAVLERGEQAMIFLNRRGYSGFVSCRSCGYVIRCPHCDVSMTLHRNGQMLCHYCGRETRAVKVCPSCGSPYIGGFRAGTQAIEEMLQKEFPAARILRMDMDTTRKKTGHETILRAFADGEADILVGTQMIVKGHDFPNVTLVGAIAADLSLFAGDYRAAEKTFQLLTQAVGRAGRGDRQGTAVIQTYHPDHYSIIAAAGQDYDLFYKEEIGYRRLMGYPPTAGLMAIHAAGMDEAQLTMAMDYIGRFLVRIGTREQASVIGPADETVSRVNDMYRKVIYVRHRDEGVLIRLREKTEQYVEINSGFRNIYIQYDFNV